MHRPEHQSTIERRIATDAVRQNRVVVLGVSPRPVPSEVERAKSQAKAGRAPCPTKHLRMTRMCKPSSSRWRPGKPSQRTGWARAPGCAPSGSVWRPKSTRQTRHALAWDVLCDAVGRDGGFVLARQALAGLESDRALIAVIDAALRKLDSQSGASISDGVADARTALQNYLFEMKVAHVTRFDLNRSTPKLARTQT